MTNQTTSDLDLLQNEIDALAIGLFFGFCIGALVTFATLNLLSLINWSAA